MMSNGANERCVKCSQSVSNIKCFGCQQSFCSRHYTEHRSYLTEQVNELNRKQELLQQELNGNTLGYPLLSSIYAWERKSMRRIQEIAEKARDDLHQWTERTKSEMKSSLDQITKQLPSNEKSDNYSEVDLQKWTQQLEELRSILEKPISISIIEDEKPSSYIRTIKVLQTQSSTPSSIVVEKNKSSFQKSPNSIHGEHFVKMYGPCELSEGDRVVTHCSYRAGLSQISGHRDYSVDKHAVDFLIEQKGVKNLFIGIISSSHKTLSAPFDSSVHGWWNFGHTIVNGESKGDETDETIVAGDRATLIVDCAHRQIQLKHHRTGKLVHLPVKLEACAFPWKILVRLLMTGDSIRILS